MIPLLLIATIVTAVAVARRPKVEHEAKHRAFQTRKPRTFLGAAALTYPKFSVVPSYLQQLTDIINAGNIPEEWIVDAAIVEALQANDFELADKISGAFQKQLLAEPPGESGDSAPPAAEETAPPEARPSPLNGVDEDEWNAFTEAMKTDAVDASSERHIGAWHQSRDRLDSLGLTEPTDEAGQYAAFEQDMADYHQNAALWTPFVAEPIEIDGSTHYVSASGALALLKAAGPKNAQRWIQNPEDRQKFPKTTEVFLRANNCF